MPPRNEVSSLRSLGVAAARALMGDAVRAVCRRLHSRGIQVSDSDPFLLDEAETARCVESCRAHLIEGAPAHLAEELAHAWIAVVGETLLQRQKGPSTCDKSSAARVRCAQLCTCIPIPGCSSQRGDQPDSDDGERKAPCSTLPPGLIDDPSYIILRLLEVALWPGLASLDLAQMPRPVRTTLYRDEFLDDFYLSSGGMGRLSHLVVFRMNYDCTDCILGAVVESSGGRLRVIDVRNSQYITDAGAEAVASKCLNLVEIAVSGTSVSVCGAATLLERFAGTLKVFVVDNLDVILRAISLRVDNCDKSFGIVEFRPFSPLESLVGGTAYLGSSSSTYHFYHEPSNLAVLSSFCPQLRRVCLDFSDGLARHRSDLERFSGLRELVLVGGNWSGEEADVLSALGNRLNALELVHVAGVSLTGLRRLSRSCVNLKSLAFRNCFIDHEDPPCEGEADAVWNSLRRLVIQSSCDGAFLLSALSLARLNLEHLVLGIATALSDDIIERFVTQYPDSLKSLRHLSVAHSNRTTMRGIQTLLDRCERLESVGDLECFTMISGAEIESLRKWARESNAKFDIDGEDGRKRGESEYGIYLESAIM